MLEKKLTMKKTIEVKRTGVSGSIVGEMQAEMKSMRKEMRLLQAENLSLQSNVRSLIQKVNSLEEEKEETLSFREGLDPPDSFDEEGDINKENSLEDSENSTTAASKSPQKNLAYRQRIKSRMSNSPGPKKVEEEEQQAFLGLTGRRSQIYKEINRMKNNTSPVKDKSRRQTMNV